MNYGRFFEFDFDSSFLEKGIVVFNYRWLKRKNHNVNQKTPRYPVYLTFTPNSISFNLHNLQEEGRHYHNTIIDIKISPNVEVADGLSECLNNAYTASFPFKDSDSKNSDHEIHQLIKDSFDAQDCRVDGYSQLEGFEPENENSYDDVEIPTHFLRKIILDFLFDLEFSNVFKNVVFYDKLSANLRKNFLFNALMNKTRYYYYRSVLSSKEVVERCLKDEDVNKCENGLLFFLEQYAKAEHEWVNSILDERAMKAFHESPWFDEAYKELEQVYFANRTGKWKKKDDRKYTYKVVDSVPSVPKVPSIDKSLRKKDAKTKYLKRINAVNDPFKLTVSNLLNLIRKKSPKIIKPKEKNPVNKAIEDHRVSAKAAANWEVGHYHFKGLWKLWFSDWSTMLWSALIGIPMVLGALFIFLLLYSNETWHPWSFVVTIVPLLATLICSGIIIRRHYRSTWGMGSLSLTMPRMLAAIVTAWFPMAMSEDLFKHFALDTIPHWPAIVILATITILFIVYESKLLNPYDRMKSIVLASLMVFLIAYVYSYIVGLMVFDYFGEKNTVQCIQDIQGNTNYYNSKDIKDIIEALEGGKVLEKAKHIFVFRFSFFASFIGIFLQLMFQGKSVTEMK